MWLPAIWAELCVTFPTSADVTFIMLKRPLWHSSFKPYFFRLGLWEVFPFFFPPACTFPIPGWTLLFLQSVLLFFSDSLISFALTLFLFFQGWACVMRWENEFFSLLNFFNLHVALLTSVPNLLSATFNACKSQFLFVADLFFLVPFIFISTAPLATFCYPKISPQFFSDPY